MTLQQLRYFKAIAEAGSFTKAAALLYVTQPNITHAIHDLEEDLGVALFLRQGRSVHLTKAGEVYLRYVNDALASLAAGQEELELHVQGIGGTVTISYLSSLHEYLPYVTSQYLHSNPSSRAEFQMTQATTTQVEQDLLEGKANFGFSTEPKDNRLHSVFLGEHPLSIIVPVNSEFSGRKSLSIKELHGKPYIAYSKICTIRHTTDAFLAEHNCTPEIVAEVRFDNLMVGMVANNLGCAIIPEPTGLCSRKIEVIPIEETMPKRNIYLLWSKTTPLPAAAARFRDYVLENPVNPKDFIFDTK